MESNLVGVTVAGLSFLLGCKSIQVIGYMARIHASFPILPPILGFFGVISSAAISYQSYLVTKEVIQQKKLIMTLNMIDVISHAAIGTILFKLTGGKFSGLFPSAVNRVGAFASSKGSISATIDYASSEQRAVINHIGRTSGCHTCGNLNPSDPFISDHMPPVKNASEKNNKLWNRILRLKVTQRFYPQCSPCSQIQSQAVRLGKTVFVHHFAVIKPYHSVGVLLCLIELILNRQDKSIDKTINRLIKEIFH